jgi:ABC-2 type transport system ATP-binding protein
MLHEPKILFLDETHERRGPGVPATLLGAHLRSRRGGTTVMVTTHFMDEAEHCDRLGFIFQGNSSHRERRRS